MSKRLLAISLVCLTLTGCGYQGHYRYPCQDPANWEAKECNPPICQVAGTCPEDLVGEDIVNPPTEKTTTDGTNNG